MKHSLETTLEKVGRILSRRYNITVRCKGCECKTNGRTIWLPAIPDQLPETTWTLIRGELDHETAHILFTDFGDRLKAFRQEWGDFGFDLLNVIEDVRVNFRMAELYPGSRINISGSIDIILEQHRISQMPLPARFLCALFLAGMELPHAQYGVDASEMAGEFQQEADGFKRLEDTDEAIAITESILKRLQERQQEKQQEAESDKAHSDERPQESDGQNSEESSKSNDSSTDSEGETGAQESTESSEEDPSDSGSSQPDPNADDCETETDSEESSELSSDEDEVDGSGESVEPAEDQGKDCACDSKGLQSDSDEDGCDTQSESDDEESSASNSEDRQSDSEPSDAETITPGGNDEEHDSSEQNDESGDAQDNNCDSGLWDEDYDSTGHPLEFSRSLEEQLRDCTEGDGTLYRAYDPSRDEICIPETNGNGDAYRNLLTQVRPHVAPLRHKLIRTLRARDAKFWASEQEEGAINSRDLHALLSRGSEKVFRQPLDAVTDSVVITLLIDLSGSMSGPRIVLARQVAILFAETLHQLRVAHEVLGFTTYESNTIVKTAVEESGLSQSELVQRYARIAPCRYSVFKGFEEPFSVIKNRVAAMEASEYTPLDEAVMLAAVRVHHRPETRKIVLVLTDGEPCSGNVVKQPAVIEHLRRNLQRIAEAGIECVAVGMQTDYVERFFPDFLVVNDLSDLPRAFYTKFAALMRRSKS